MKTYLKFLFSENIRRIYEKNRVFFGMEKRFK